MSCSDVVQGVVNEDSTFSLLARVHVDGAIWAQADVNTIIYSAWNINDKTTAVVDGVSLVVADTVYDALQTDGRWTIDVTGYNFLHTIGPTILTTPGTYRIEHKVTLAGGAVFFLGPWEVVVGDLWTS